MKRLIFAIFAGFLALSAHSTELSNGSWRFLDAVTRVGPTLGRVTNKPLRTYQVSGLTTAGAGAAVVRVECSLSVAPTVDGEWATLHTFTLVLSTTRTSGVTTSNNSCPQIRMYVVSISGTGAAVTGLMKD